MFTPSSRPGGEGSHRLLTFDSLASSSEWLVRLAAGGLLVLAAFGVVLLFARTYIGRRERGRRSRGLLGRLLRDAVEVLAEPPVSALPSRDLGGEQTSRTAREALLAALGGVALAIVMTWPLALHLGSDH